MWKGILEVSRNEEQMLSPSRKDSAVVLRAMADQTEDAPQEGGD